MLRLPMHPRYSRMLVEASKHGCVPAAALCAALVSLDAPDRHGRFADVTLGSDTFAGYADNPFYLGATAGRFANRIANARLNDMHEVWEHPQLRARGRWTEVATPAGPIPALLPPGQVDTFAPRMDAVPALGQHTDAILRELGWDAAAIDSLRQAGAI